MSSYKTNLIRMSLFFAILSFFLPIKVYGQEEETNKQEKILEELMNDPYVKEHLGWKLVIGQHPMYLLIDEDRGTPRVGERVPPWGAPNKEGYVERVKRNLSSLDKIEGLRINYQWSAVELNHMCENFPDVYKELKKHYESGMLDFVDGSYSQAHLQVLSSESNWRQFEYGQEVYKDLFGKNIEVYARQETGLHHQVPQLLEKFGYRFATLPAFHAAVEVVEGPFEFISQMGRFEAQTGDEFLEWVGLDGTAVPTYISIHLGWDDIREHALIDRYEAAPPRAKARIHSYWSYIEGTWAEELMRVMRQAEEKALMAEQMVAIAKAAGVETDAGAEIKELWKEILKAQ
ncbi:MAG: glycoside hydrolase family 38 N-terminal domain-containing protein, partial [Planctomycetota bacterium]